MICSYNYCFFSFFLGIPAAAAIVTSSPPVATLQPQVPLNAIQSLVKQAKEKSGGDGLASIADIITKVMPHSSTNQICQATGLTKHYVDAARASTIGTSSLISGKPYRKKRSDALDENSPEIKQLYDFFLVGGYTRCSPNRKDVYVDTKTGQDIPCMLYWLSKPNLWEAYRQWHASNSLLYAEDLYPKVRKYGSDDEDAEEDTTPTKKEEGVTTRTYPGVCLNIFVKVSCL